VGDGYKAMLTLKDDVLGKLMLRRTKKERAADMELPPLTTEVVELTLGTFWKYGYIF